MRYEVRHCKTARVSLDHDILICFEHGLTKSMAYVPVCGLAHVVVESINDKLAIAYMIDSKGDMHALTIVHVFDITGKHGVLRKLLGQIQKECDACDNFELVCELTEMELFINGIIDD